MQGNGTRRYLTINCNSQAANSIIRPCILALSLVAGVGWGLVAEAQPPGPELFARPPKTSLELWDAIDYLMRTGQANKAVPYLDRFMKMNPDGATLLAIRNRYGAGSILRLSDDPATRTFAKPLAEALIEASKKYPVQPDRITQSIESLTKQPVEQDYAIRHLREAGPYAVPFLVDALAKPDLVPADHQLIVQGMGKLDRSAIPPMLALLDGANASLAADAATALGMIGDRAAIPFLTYPAAAFNAPLAVRSAAQNAIERLTGQPFSAQPKAPVEVLLNAAWRYHRHQVEFDDDLVTVWVWDKDRRAPVPRDVPRVQVDTTVGLALARHALALAPTNRLAHVVELSITLEEAARQVGFSSIATKDQTVFTAAKAAGPTVLADVLETAIADGKGDLAVAAVMALGQLTDSTALTSRNRPHPIVNALVAPERRVQFAAAKVVTALSPKTPFPGSSWVVQTLARFAINQRFPRAVVIDSNPNRGGQLAGFLISLGYDSELELTGNLGFRAAIASADVELILVSFDLFRPGWGLADTLANLVTDRRTAAIPVFVYGPLNLQYNRPNWQQNYPSVKFLVHPGDSDTLKSQLKGLPVPMSEAERMAYRTEAVTLLARISSEPNSPLAADLPGVEPALTVSAQPG